jgi:hypothetical protein
MNSLRLDERIAAHLIICRILRGQLSLHGVIGSPQSASGQLTSIMNSSSDMLIDPSLRELGRCRDIGYDLSGGFPKLLRVSLERDVLQ